MKKAIITFLIGVMPFAIIVMLAICAGCNRDIVYVNNHFDRAIMRMPDGSTIEVQIEKWADADGEQLIITGKDGKRYLISSENCVLIENEAD